MTSDFVKDSKLKAIAFPKSLFIVWLLSMPGTIYLVAQLVYEQTFLTWTSGPQMVGFALVHSTTILPLLGSLVLSLISFLASFSWLVVKTLKRQKASRFALISLLCTFVLILLLLVPYGIWQTIMIETLGPGDHSEELFFHFAATGSRPAVRSLLNSGVDINSMNRSGKTALMGACVEGQDEIVEYLIAKGADVNLKSTDGKTARDYAVETAHSQTAEILRKHGSQSRHY